MWWACILLLGVASKVLPLPVWNSGCSWCTPSHDCPAACCSWCTAKEPAWCWPASACARPADEPTVGPVCTEGAEKEPQSIGGSVGWKREASHTVQAVCKMVTEHMCSTWWSSMSRSVHLTFTSPGLFTWKPSVSWVVGILCHWKIKLSKKINFF